jgi:tetratricopeptide (TPR) repeat protein
MRRTPAAAAAATAALMLAAAPLGAQDARTEPTFEEMVERALGPENCDKVELELLIIAAKRWPSIRDLLVDLAYDPRNSRLHTKIGNQFGGMSLWPLARRFYQCAVRFDEDNAHAWNNLGLIHLGRHEVGDAIEAFQRAIKIDPNYARAHYHLGMAYDVDNRYDDALRSYQRALGLDPRLGLARFNPQVATNPHRLELFMYQLLSEEVLRGNLGDPDEPD